MTEPLAGWLEYLEARLTLLRESASIFRGDQSTASQIAADSLDRQIETMTSLAIALPALIEDQKRLDWLEDNGAIAADILDQGAFEFIRDAIDTARLNNPPIP